MLGIQKVEEPLIPLSEANSDIINFAISLPSSIDPASIGVRLDTLGKLLQHGGIGHLKVRTADTAVKFAPYIANTNPDGTATSLLSGVKADSHKLDVDFHKP